MSEPINEDSPRVVGIVREFMSYRKKAGDANAIESLAIALAKEEAAHEAERARAARIEEAARGCREAEVAVAEWPGGDADEFDSSHGKDERGAHRPRRRPPGEAVKAARREIEEENSAEAGRIADHLASMPGLGHAAVTAKVLRALLLETGGQLMCRGHLYEVVSKHLGAGIYRVTTKLWEEKP